MWDYLESLPLKVDRHDPDTWSNESWLPSATNGILHGFGFGQSDCMWHIRLLPDVKAAFAAIWGEEALTIFSLTIFVKS